MATEKKPAKSDKEITGRSMTLKQMVVLKNPVIVRRKRSRGEGFMYQGVGEGPDGNKVYAMMGADHALACIKSGHAKKDEASWKASEA